MRTLRERLLDEPIDPLRLRSARVHEAEGRGGRGSPCFRRSGSVGRFSGLLSRMIAIGSCRYHFPTGWRSGCISLRPEARRTCSGR